MSAACDETRKGEVRCGRGAEAQPQGDRGHILFQERRRRDSSLPQLSCSAAQRSGSPTNVVSESRKRVRVATAKQRFDQAVETAVAPFAQMHAQARRFINGIKSHPGQPPRNVFRARSTSRFLPGPRISKSRYRSRMTAPESISALMLSSRMTELPSISPPSLSPEKPEARK